MMPGAPSTAKSTVFVPLRCRPLAGITGGADTKTGTKTGGGVGA